MLSHFLLWALPELGPLGFLSPIQTCLHFPLLLALFLHYEHWSLLQYIVLSVSNSTIPIIISNASLSSCFSASVLPVWGPYTDSNYTHQLFSDHSPCHDDSPIPSFNSDDLLTDLFWYHNANSIQGKISTSFRYRPMFYNFYVKWWHSLWWNNILFCIFCACNIQASNLFTRIVVQFCRWWITPLFCK